MASLGREGTDAAAHSGCNTALESAVALAAAVDAASASNGPITRADLSKAFADYSATRMPEAKEVQRRSALAARAMTNSALADLRAGLQPGPDA